MKSTYTKEIAEREHSELYKICTHELERMEEHVLATIYLYQYQRVFCVLGSKWRLRPCAPVCCRYRFGSCCLWCFCEPDLQISRSLGSRQIASLPYFNYSSAWWTNLSTGWHASREGRKPSTWSLQLTTKLLVG